MLPLICVTDLRSKLAGGRFNEPKEFGAAHWAVGTIGPDSTQVVCEGLIVVGVVLTVEGVVGLGVVTTVEEVFRVVTVGFFQQYFGQS